MAAGQPVGGGVDAGRGGLDELMLAMDVVDTLRHEEAALQREISREEREDVLMERLRGLYAAQGIPVTDDALRAGIAALREKRFAYRRRGSSFGRAMARAWITRGRIGAVVGVLVALLVGWQALGVWQARQAQEAEIAARAEIEEVLPERLANLRAAALAQAETPDARAAVEALATRAERAVAAQDADSARTALAELEALRETLARSYVLRIVNDPDVPTGVFRIPDVNERARNYYLVVEAIDPSGRVLTLPILNEETNTREEVSVFGVRVPERTFEAVRRDKEDDGILQANRLGEKPAGALETDWLMPVEGGIITRW
ncbi:DUF6384 family protein [Salinarimonas ramus]|uniref:Uncharacterized protein n=1 Tax=Salinarimonas ramus TaxID=690164 RepID=A0A917V663_9HYPH|nr:DUF6384 family protein [Salinarimonas ramus]GGK43107.1 hypothetical protein GCM10011322_32840 [Salinarimonas ramus]